MKYDLPPTKWLLSSEKKKKKDKFWQECEDIGLFICCCWEDRMA